MKVLMMSALASALLFASVAQAQLKPEKQVEVRQAGYQFMSWNMGKIKAQVVDGSEPYDQAKVAAAADAIAGIANSGMGALFGPDTTTAQLGDLTRLKPEFFSDLEEVSRIGAEYVKNANQLKTVAADNDQAAIKQAFGALGNSCKACHDKFRAE